MQTATAKEVVTKLHVTSYELITLWIDRGYKLNLSSSANHLMTVLLRFYNSDKKIVFPHQETLAERMNTSISTVKRALNELVQANLIIKRRKQTGNIYGFTGKLFDLLNVSNCTIQTVQDEPCMKEPNKESNKKTSSCKKIDDDFKQIKMNHKHVKLEDVPKHIKDDKHIKKPCAYWASLSSEAKEEQLKQEQIYLEKLKKLELKKQESAKIISMEQKRQEQEEKENNLPFDEYWTFDRAVEYLKTMKRTFKNQVVNKMYVTQLLELHHLKLEDV